MSVWYRGSIIPDNVPVDVVHTYVHMHAQMHRCWRAHSGGVHSCVYTYVSVYTYMEEKRRNVPLRRQTSAWRELKQSVRGWLHRFSTLPPSNPPLHSFCPAPLFIVSVHAVFALLLLHPLHSTLPGYRLARVTSLDRSKVDWRRDATSY